MILGIGAALRPGASTAAILNALKEEAGERFLVFDQLRDIPPFDDGECGPAVSSLRHLISEATAVIIVTPEYAYAPPGVLKNALDWLVGSGELNGKPVAVVSGSSSGGGGVSAQLVLLQTLNALGTQLLECLAVANIRSKFDTEGRLIDTPTRHRLKALYEGLPK